MMVVDVLRLSLTAFHVALISNSCLVQKKLIKLISAWSDIRLYLCTCHVEPPYTYCSAGFGWLGCHPIFHIKLLCAATWKWRNGLMGPG